MDVDLEKLEEYEKKPVNWFWGKLLRFLYLGSWFLDCIPIRSKYGKKKPNERVQETSFSYFGA